MWGVTGVAGQRALSGWTLLIAAAGLALFQMTSLTLGPGGSRQLHLSLTVPGVDADERTPSWTSVTIVALGTRVGPAPAAPAWAGAAVTHRASGAPAEHRAPAPQPSSTHPSNPVVPTIVGRSDPQPGTRKSDDPD